MLRYSLWVLELSSYWLRVRTWENFEVNTTLHSNTQITHKEVYQVPLRTCLLAVVIWATSSCLSPTPTSQTKWISHPIISVFYLCLKWDKILPPNWELKYNVPINLKLNRLIMTFSGKREWSGKKRAWKRSWEWRADW